jgi:hypothetical protein
MDIELYFESSTSIVGWNDRLKCVVLRRKPTGYPDSTTYKTNLSKILELAKLKSASKVLFEMSHMRVMSDEDQDWFVEKFVPVAATGGVRSIVFTKPDSSVARFSLKSLGAKIKQVEFAVIEPTEIEKFFMARK